MPDNDDLDSLLDAYDEQVTQAAARDEAETSARARWYREFSDWAESVAKPAMETFRASLEAHDHEVRIQGYAERYVGADEAIATIEILVTFKAGRGALFRVTRDSRPKFVYVERGRRGTQAGQRPREPFEGMDAEWVRAEVRDVLSRALSGEDDWS